MDEKEDAVGKRRRPQKLQLQQPEAGDGKDAAQRVVDGATSGAISGCCQESGKAEIFQEEQVLACLLH